MGSGPAPNVTDAGNLRPRGPAVDQAIEPDPLRRPALLAQPPAAVAETHQRVGPVHEELVAASIDADRAMPGIVALVGPGQGGEFWRAFGADGRDRAARADPDILLPAVPGADDGGAVAAEDERAHLHARDTGDELVVAHRHEVS